MFLGCCICGKMTEISKANKKYIIESEEFTCSLNCVKGWIKSNDKYDSVGKVASEMLHNVYAYPRHSGSIRYRSEYENRVAYFVSNILDITFGYEMHGFNLSTGTYTPDFWLRDFNVFFEVKGIITVGWRKKLKRFREEYPEVKLLFIPWILKDKFYNLPNLCGLRDVR